MNPLGPLLSVKHAASHLRASGRGSVVNVDSIGGKRPCPNRTAYAASKRTPIRLTRTLAYELVRDDVTVDILLPGPVRNDRIQPALEKQSALANVEGADPLSIGENDVGLADSSSIPQTSPSRAPPLRGRTFGR